MKHVIQSQQFTPALLDHLFEVADSLEGKVEKTLTNKIMATVFYEPSTRTRFSFEAAMLRLGGQVVSTENAREFSSAMKGESLEDTIRVMSNYADVLVLRHTEEGAAEKAAAVSPIPIINAGDGKGQHPTQALLDLFTIKRELGKINGLAVAIVGDLKYGRTVRSLSYLLGKYKKIKIYLVSPPSLKIGSDIKDYLTRHGVAYEESQNMEAVLPKIDVLYMTRIQKERIANQAIYEKVKNTYRLTKASLKKMQSHTIVMHPLPRLEEIDSEVDASPRALYFKQTYYGLLIRMALLKFLLEK